MPWFGKMKCQIFHYLSLKSLGWAVVIGAIVGGLTGPTLVSNNRDTLWWFCLAILSAGMIVCFMLPHHDSDRDKNS